MAAFRGELSTINYLISLAPEQAPSMIISKNYQAFKTAARRGKLDVVMRIAQLLPDYVPYMIKNNDFEVFRNAYSHYNRALA